MSVSATRRALVAALVLAALVGAAPLTAPAQQPIAVIIDGQTVALDAPPIEEEGRILVPLRGIFERLGASVKWDPIQQKVTAQTAAITVELTIGSVQATVNGKTVQLEVPPRMVEGRVYVPLRFVGEAFGATVEYKADTRTVVITTAKPAETVVTPQAQRIIQKVVARGILLAGPDGGFNPGGTLTRLDMVRAIIRALGMQGVVAQSSFKDIADLSAADKNAVGAAMSIGLMARTSTEQRKGDLVFRLSTDKTIYQPGEYLTLTLEVQNNGKSDLQWTFATSQQYDFVIRAGLNEIARWSLGKAFIAQEIKVPLAAGQKFVYQTRWLQLDQNDNPVPAGRYELLGVFLARESLTQMSLFYQKGLLFGLVEDEFRPTETVTRAELAAVMVRAMGLDNEAAAKSQNPMTFADAAAIPAWARGYAIVANEQKVLVAYEDGSWRATAPVSRAEAAAAFNAWLETSGRYNYIEGTIVDIAAGANTIRIRNAAGQLIAYRLAATFAIYRNDRPAQLSDLKAGDRVRMLGQSEVGLVGYIEASGP